MLMIRLQRVGKKHDPSFRVVLTDSKNSTKSGKFTEVLGSYDARKGGAQLKKDRISYWLSVGAKTSVTVHNILVSNKIISSNKLNALPKKKKTESSKEEVKVESVTPVSETPSE